MKMRNLLRRTIRTKRKRSVEKITRNAEERKVTAEEAQEFLEFKEKTAPKIAMGVSLWCPFSGAADPDGRSCRIPGDKCFRGSGGNAWSSDTAGDSGSSGFYILYTLRYSFF